jgi:hypothetical protein
MKRMLITVLLLTVTSLLIAQESITIAVIPNPMLEFLKTAITLPTCAEVECTTTTMVEPTFKEYEYEVRYAALDPIQHPIITDKEFDVWVAEYKLLRMLDDDALFGEPDLAERVYMFTYEGFGPIDERADGYEVMSFVDQKFTVIINDGEATYEREETINYSIYDEGENLIASGTGGGSGEVAEFILAEGIHNNAVATVSFINGQPIFDNKGWVDGDDNVMVTVNAQGFFFEPELQAISGASLIGLTRISDFNTTEMPEKQNGNNEFWFTTPDDSHDSFHFGKVWVFDLKGTRLYSGEISLDAPEPSY